MHPRCLRLQGNATQAQVISRYRSFGINKINNNANSVGGATRRHIAQDASASKGAAGGGPGQSAQSRSYDYYRKKRSSSWMWWRSSQKQQKPQTSTADRNVQVAWYLGAVVVGAVGATYASVPLYKVFCQATGFGGTTQRVIFEDRDSAPSKIEQYLTNGLRWLLPQSSQAKVHTWTDEDAAAKLASLRPVENANMITVRFDSTVNDVLPWTFKPVQLDIKVVPGETALSFFRVTNKSDKAITGVATYNVYPPKMGLYFQKIQCFCFEEQRLLPGSTVDMPVFFFIDPEMLDDPQVSYVTDVTLSYTFFQTDEDDDDYDDDEKN